jgi:hypothetical protein
MYILWRRRPAAAWAPVALFAAYVMAVHAPIIAHARHSVPLVPFLAIFAGIALSGVWRRFRGGRQPALVRSDGARLAGASSASRILQCP